jgi:hypothetical protein
MHTSQIGALTNELPMVIEASIEGIKAATISPSLRSSSRSNSSYNDTVGNKRDRASIEQEASMNGAVGG